MKCIDVRSIAGIVEYGARGYRVSDRKKVVLEQPVEVRVSSGNGSTLETFYEAEIITHQPMILTKNECSYAKKQKTVFGMLGSTTSCIPKY